MCLKADQFAHDHNMIDQDVGPGKEIDFLDSNKLSLCFQQGIDPKVAVELYLLYSQFLQHESIIKIIYDKILFLEEKVERCCGECP
jgi:hypothetical protein